MHDSEIDQKPRISVLPDAGPKEMAKSAGVDPSFFSAGLHGRAHEIPGVASLEPEIYSPDAQLLHENRAEENLRAHSLTPASKRAIDRANWDYHGELDPDA